jgi:hypothetical protein
MSTRVFALVYLAYSLVGCAQVAAYDRGKLAHPTMSTSDIAGAGEEHVRSVHEGASGGNLGAGGGCGCN